MFDRPCRRQDASCRLIRKVVLGMVPEMGIDTLDLRLGLSRVQWVDAALLESAAGLPI